jgi:hypothetical protein
MPSVSLPTVMLATSVAGAGISAYGAYSTGQANSANAAYQAQVAQNNAAIARQNAGLETQTGEIQAANQGMKTRAMIGKTMAEQGASGVDVNSGSPVAVRSAEAKLGMLDALTIRANAARKAYGYQVAATGDVAEGQLLETESQQAAAAAPISALGSFLGGVSTAGSRFAMMGGSLGGGGGAGSAVPAGYNPNVLSALV